MDLAKLMGCSQPAVSQMVSKGVVRLRPDGKIDLVQAQKDWNAHVTPATTFGKRKEAEPKTIDGKKDSERYYKARADREEAEAAMVKLELAEKEKALLDAKITEAIYTNGLITLRNNILAVSRSVAPSLVGITDENVIADKIYQANELALFSVIDHAV